MLRSLVAAAVLLAAVSGCSLDGDDEPDAKPAQPKTCTAGTATEASRVTISASGLDHSCVTVRRKVGFTLLNVDKKTHDFSTAKGAPKPLRVQLKKGAAFPYEFTKAGTYRFEDAESDLVLTVIVP